MIRKAKASEIKLIKKIVDSAEEMDVISETFTEAFYKRILKKGILLVAIEDNVVGVCFGTYNSKEKWADILGLVINPQFRGKGYGKALVNEFEEIAKRENLRTIDLYVDQKELELFRSLGYKQGRTYTAFRKALR